MPSVNPVVEPEVIDPVCGMSILPSDAVGQVTHRGQTYHFCSQSCLDKFRAVARDVPEPRGGRAAPARARRHPRVHLPDGPRGAADRAGRVPEVRHGARAGVGRAADEDRVDLPDAPGDRAGRARVVPDLRHGAGAARRDARGAEPRARRHDAPVPVVARADGADPRVHGVGVPAGAAAAARAAAGGDDLVAVPAGDAGRAVGRLAVLRARLGVGREPPPEHVHADRAGRRARRTRSASSRRWRPGLFPASFRDARRSDRRLLRAGRGHRRARAARPGAGAAGAQPHQLGHQEAAGPGADDGAAHRRRRRRAGRAARARAGRRSAARAAGRARAGGRRGPRGHDDGRRVDGDGRADPGREGARRAR